MKKIYFIPVFILLQSGVTAQQPIAATAAASFYVVDSAIQLHNLRPVTFVFADETNNIPFEEIASGKFADRFKPVNGFKQFKNYTAYWLKLSIETRGSIKNRWLMLRDSSADYYTANSNAVQYNFVDVYFCNGNGKLLSKQRTGTFVPRSEKQIKNEAAISRVLFSAAAGEKQIIYLKIYNTSGERAPAYVEIHDPAVSLPAGNGDRFIFVQGGIIFFFSLFSFCLFFFVKERSYLFFGLYTLLLTQVYLLVHSRLPFIDWYIPEHPQWIVFFDTILVPGIYICFLLFGRTFIHLPALSKQTDKYLKFFIIAWCVVVMIKLTEEAIGRHTVFLAFSNLFFTVFTFLFVIRFAFFKNIFARLFIVGGLWLLCFSILGFLDNIFGFMPFRPFPVGQLGQLLIFAVALAYKIKLNEQAKAESDSIKEIDDIKSRFFANISHEFRTPLTLIQGPLQQIEERAAEGRSPQGYAEVSLRQVHTMRRYTDRLLELVNQLLDLSKLDSGNMKMQVIKGDVLQIVRVLAASFESIAEQRQIHYHFHLPEQTAITFFDKDKLEKIVTNLLGNAFKYTSEKGTVSLHVACDENRIRLEFADSGPGISRKDLVKVFDRFYQVAGTEDKGTGIGLALVKELVDLYGGQITVSSEPGKGTCFKVSLPVGKNAFDESQLVYGAWENNSIPVNNGNAMQEDNPALPAGVINNGPLVLIVEDNADLRHFIYETIQKEYTVLEASNGKEGLEKAIAEIPDLIISDVMMPLIDGFKMTTKLKNNERTSHIPVILLTAKAGRQHQLEGLETGADDYLTKPFDAKELLIRMENLIQQRKLLRKKFAGSIMLKPSEIAVNSADEIFLTQVLQAIEKNMGEENFGVEELAREVNMSRSQLHRKLVALTNQSPGEVLRNTRLFRAMQLLQKKFASPSEVAFKVGFNSHTYFSKCFREEFGISPGEV